MLDPRAWRLRIRGAHSDSARMAVLGPYWAVLLAACALAWSFRLVSFLHAKELALIIGMGGLALCLPRALIPSTEGLRFFMPLWIGLGVCFVTGLFGATVSAFHVEETLRVALVLLAATCCYSALQYPQGRRWIRGGFWAGGAAVAMLALLQYWGWAEALLPAFPGYDQRAYSVFGNQNLLGGYLAPCAAMAAAWLLRVRRMPPWSLASFHLLFLLSAAGLVVSQTRTAWLAAVAGGLCAVPWRTLVHDHRTRARAARRMLPMAALGVMVVLAGWPLLWARSTHSFSEDDVGGRARIWFWAGAARMIRDHPVAGVGMGNYRRWSPYYQGAALWAPGGDRLFHNELHTVHAHSEPIERLAENGVLGSLFIAWFLLKIPRRRGAAWAGLVSLLAFSMFNTVSHSAPHLLMILLLGAMIHARRPADCRNPRYSAPSGGWRPFRPAAAAIALMGANLWVIHIPSYLQCAAEQAHVRGEDPRDLYRRALRFPWFVPQAHEHYAIALMERNLFQEAQGQLDRAAEGLDTGRVHLLKAICAAADPVAGRRERAAAVVRHARACLHRWPSNEQAWSLLLDHLPPEEATRERSRRERWNPAAPTP